MMRSCQGKWSATPGFRAIICCIMARIVPAAPRLIRPESSMITALAMKVQAMPVTIAGR
ncbi:MAG TPA: hypothetical protein VGR44_09630 [Methylomirabilota bacterium]|nr:hypothetical protein [Methylomirabilota bacterium]